MDPLLRMFWYISLPISLIFIIQFAMVMMGLGGDGDIEIESDAEADNFEVADAAFDPFTIRNLINFLLGFGWGGVSFSSVFGPGVIATVLAFASGIIFVLAFFYILRMVHGLSEDNTSTIAHTLHQKGEVYTTIPADMKGVGKVLLKVNGSVKELKAKSVVSSISPGTAIKVIGIDDKNIVIVEPINLIN